MSSLFQSSDYRSSTLGGTQILKDPNVLRRKVPLSPPAFPGKENSARDIKLRGVSQGNSFKKKDDKKAGGGWRRVLVILTVFLGGFLGLEVLFQLIIAPYFTIEEVHITAGKGMTLSNEQIMDIAGLQEKVYYFNIKQETIVKRLESYPLIREAVVEKNFPDSLSIYVYPRKPLAVSVVNTRDFSVPAALDSNGVVFQIGSSVTLYDAPAISGVQFQDIKLGMRLPEQLVPFLKELETLKENAPLLFSLISEVQFIKKSQNKFEVLLHTIHYKIPVRIASHIDEHLLKYILVTLDVITKQDFSREIKELDFRNGEVVYRIKEE